MQLCSGCGSSPGRSVSHPAQHWQAGRLVQAEPWCHQGSTSELPCHRNLHSMVDEPRKRSCACLCCMPVQPFHTGPMWHVLRVWGSFICRKLLEHVACPLQSCCFVATPDWSLACLQGPREDSGFTSGKHPGVALIKRIYDYCSTQHPDTKVMVSGIREKEGLHPQDGMLHGSQRCLPYCATSDGMDWRYQDAAASRQQCRSTKLQHARSCAPHWPGPMTF